MPSGELGRPFFSGRLDAGGLIVPPVCSGLFVCLCRLGLNRNADNA